MQEDQELYMSDQLTANLERIAQLETDDVELRRRISTFGEESTV